MDYNAFNEYDRNLNRESRYKILVVGDSGCGKTSFIHRFVSNSFTTDYKATIGVDYAVKKLNWNSSTKICLQLWDIGGQPRFAYMTKQFYRSADAALLVFDVTSSVTFKNVLTWKKDIDEKISEEGRTIPILLIANKIDLQNQMDIKEMMSKFVKDHGFLGWFATSVKNDINVQQSGIHLVRALESNNQSFPSQDESANLIFTPSQEGHKVLNIKTQSQAPKKKKSFCLI